MVQCKKFVSKDRGTRYNVEQEITLGNIVGVQHQKTAKKYRDIFHHHKIC